MLTMLTILAMVCFFVPVLACGFFRPVESFWTPWALIGFPLLYAIAAVLLGGLVLLEAALPLMLVVGLSALLCELFFHGGHRSSHPGVHTA